MYESYTEIGANVSPNEGRTIINGQFQQLYNNLTGYSQNLSINSLSANTLSASTIYSGSTNLSNLFAPKELSNVSLTATTDSPPGTQIVDIASHYLLYGNYAGLMDSNGIFQLPRISTLLTDKTKSVQIIISNTDNYNTIVFSKYSGTPNNIDKFLTNAYNLTMASGTTYILTGYLHDTVNEYGTWCIK